MTSSISNLLNFSLVYADQIGYYVQFGIMFIKNFFGALGGGLTTIALIARFSEVSPEGLEATGITFLAAGLNITALINGQLSIFLVNYFDIKAGYYDRSFGAFAVCTLAVAFLSAITPVFSLIKLRKKY